TFYQRAVAGTRFDGGLALPALSIACTAYTYATPAWTVSGKVVSGIGVGVIGSSLSPGAGPRSTTYPARSFSVFGSQIRLMAPAVGTAFRSFGAAGGNVSLRVMQAGGGASLSSI